MGLGEHIAKTAAYYAEIQPILRDMATLATLYRQPVWHRVDDPTQRAGESIQVSHYVWTHQEMAVFFGRLEALIAEIREGYFGSGSD